MINFTEFLNCTVGNASVEYAQCLDDVPPYEDCPDPSVCEDASGNNVGLAFGLTIGAGLATTLGALLPFVPFIKPRKTRFLAAAMALAAGVMLYVSFTEIRTKSLNSFCCVSLDHYDVLATSCFFGGIVLTAVLDLLVWALQKVDCGFSSARLKRVKFSMGRDRGITQGEEKTEDGWWQKSAGKDKFRLRSINGNGFVLDDMERLDSSALILPCGQSGTENTSQSTTPTASSLEKGCDVALQVEVIDMGTEKEGESVLERRADEEENSVLQSQTLTASDGVSISLASNTMSENTNNIATASVNELFSNSSLLRMNAVIPESASVCTAAVSGAEEKGVNVVGDSASRVCVEPAGPDDDNGGAVRKRSRARRNSYQEMVDTEFVPLGPEEFRDVADVVTPDKKSLKRMGLLTGLAIGLHNLPEGLATFVATLSSPSLGGALALAIALHNIPEGVCVSMPVYYATGSKVKAFLWSFLSGISEPLGALLGWLVLKDHFGPLVYGVSFGVIAGMMVYISVKELLPTAQRFDKNGSFIVPLFLTIGMAAMALSLLLFLY